MKNRWIRIENKLPDNQNTVLVCLSGNNGIGTARYGCYDMKSSIPKWFDFSYEIEGAYEPVIAWQPLERIE